MASTYTEGLGIEIIGNGDKAGSWGSTTNNNLESLEFSIVGYAQISCTGSSQTVNVVDGSDWDDANSSSRAAVIEFTGTPGTTHTVTIQTGGAARTYSKFIAINNTDSTVVIDNATATDLSIPSEFTAFVHIDSSGDVVNSIDTLFSGTELRVGDNSDATTISSNGDQDIVLQTGNTTTGTITVTDGANGNITVAPNGTGDVVLAPSGAGDVVVGNGSDAISVESGGTTNLTLQSGASGGSILLRNSGNITITPAGGGNVTTASTVVAPTFQYGSGTMTVQSTGGNDLNVAANAANLTLSTVTSGNVVINPVGNVVVQSAALDMSSSDSSIIIGSSSAGALAISSGTDTSILLIDTSSNIVYIKPDFEFRAGDINLRSAGGGYINIDDSVASGSSGYGLRRNSSTLEVKNTSSDDWGQPYHSGMVNGQGAYFESTTSPITVSSNISASHTLSATPRIVKAVIKCNDAGGDVGWAQNDEIVLGADGGLGASIGALPYANGTVVGCVTGNAIQVLNKTVFSVANIDPTKWDLIIRAWK